jgi:cytochrome c biogenesis protein CcmG, thiol:disulfide interchange protein DsbE
MDHSIRSRVDTQPPPEKVPVWVVVLSFTVLLVFFIVIGIGLYKLKEKPVIVGSTAPEFVLTSFDGDLYDNESLKGKIVVLHFWASWCSPCEGEALLIENAWRQFDDKRDIIFLGVSQADTEKESMVFLNENQITYPNGSDTNTLIADAFQIRGVPETIIIDRDGNIAYIQVGPFMTADSLVDILQNMD